MRRRELLELQWQHVHLQEGYVDLPGNITKNRKPRIVPFHHGERLFAAVKVLPPTEN